jgi:peptidoglycan hydrolase-like protein with peptidoglycan-binding domain
MPEFPFAFSGYTAANGWRPLRLKKARYQRGWDVYDLQCKLAYLAYAIDTDGFFGPKTEAVVEDFQWAVGPLAGPVDGIAGVRTQVALGVRVCDLGDLPLRTRGQMEKESSLLCGIYTAPYGDGSFDRGPVQENSRYHPDHEAAFDVRDCLPVLWTRIRTNARRYMSMGVAEERAWAAAQGHWNSPLYADRYATGSSVPTSFLEYIDAVTAYA